MDNYAGAVSEARRRWSGRIGPGPGAARETAWERGPKAVGALGEHPIEAARFDEVGCLGVALKPLDDQLDQDRPTARVARELHLIFGLELLAHHRIFVQTDGRKARIPRPERDQIDVSLSQPPVHCVPMGNQLARIESEDDAGKLLA